VISAIATRLGIAIKKIDDYQCSTIFVGSRIQLFGSKLNGAA
jgi:hypothetical protein